MDLQLNNKIVVVAGATGVIGIHICKAFLEEGSIVIPVYRKSIKKLDELFSWSAGRQIPEASIFPVEMEIEDTESVMKGVGEIIARFQRIDVLVNAAGVCPEELFLLMDDESFDEVVRVNLTSAARMMRIVGKYMWKERSGSIITISSIIGKRYGRGIAAYAASKAAIDRLTEALALEFGKKGIRVNAVCPGIIQSGMSQGLQMRLNENLAEGIALNKIGQPEDVAFAVLFLASEKTASYITGQKIYVDGGVGI